MEKIVLAVSKQHISLAEKIGVEVSGKYKYDARI